MASATKLDFVPARQQEAVHANAKRFKIISPKPVVKRHRRGLGPVVRDTPSGTDESNEESDFKPFDESSVDDNDDKDDSEEEDDEEDSDVDSEDDSEDEDEFNEADSDNDEMEDDDADELKDLKEDSAKVELQSALTASGTSEVEPDEMSEHEFYDINELSTDRGQRKPARIYKSWQSSARAPVGLENGGVTCYQNAAIQALIHLPAFGRYLMGVLRGDFANVAGRSVTYELARLFSRLTESRKPLFPSGMLRRLGDINPMLDVSQQEDAHEYFMSLLGRIQEDSVPRGEKLRSSIIHDIFGGSVEQKVTCLRCDAVSTTTQDFYDLPISFSASESKGKYTMQKSIKDFFTPEIIEPHKSEGTVYGGYQCEKCKAQTKAVKQIAIAEAPEYLTVHIKRFKMDGSVSKKVKEVMSYPIEMSLTRYEKNQSVPLHYKLVSVILHEGRTVYSGHYIALTRQPNNEWVMYDDETVRKVPESYVRSHPSAYILIYSRLTPKKKKSKDVSVSKASALNGKAAKKAKVLSKVPTKASKEDKKTKVLSKAPSKLRGKAPIAVPSSVSKERVPKERAPMKRAIKSHEKQHASSSIDEIFGAKKRKRSD